MTSREDVFLAIRQRHPEGFFIFSNGLTARHAVQLFGVDGNLYLYHAMGEARSIGIGLARERIDAEIVIVEGDGNALMGSSSWALEAPPNLTHYVLSNHAYATTGGQLLPQINWPGFLRVLVIDEESTKAPNPPAPCRIIGATHARLRSEEQR